MTDEEKAPYRAQAEKLKEEYKMGTSSATSSSFSESVSQPSNVQPILKRNSKDVGWDYGMLVDGKNMDKIQCMKCGKIMSGGIYRLKEHVAHISGNVVPCSKASKEDQAICRNAINEAKFKRRKKVGSEELRSTLNIHKNSIKEEVYGDQLHESLGATESPITLGPMDKFVSARNFESSIGFGGSRLQEHNINDALFKERTESVKKLVCRWVYEAGIPFNSIQLDSFKLMVDAIGQFGSGFVPPTRYEMTVPYLMKEVARTKDILKKHEEDWKINGCSIMIDAWSDRKRRNVVNLCVNSRLGTVFLSFKDFSNMAYTSDAIFEYVDKCIENVGPNNVVQVVAHYSLNNMDASKLLKKKRPNIFWTSCAAHTINLILEAIAKQPRFKKIIDHAKILTVFLYAHHKVLAIMRAHTKKGDIVRPGVTRLVSSFFTLQSLLEEKFALKKMFLSPEWEECKFSIGAKGKMAYLIVMSLGFWDGVTLYLQVFTPLIKVLQIAYCDRKSPMGFLYGELLQAKEEIKIALKNVPKNYESIIQVIDETMKGKLDSHLHLMAYGLNPFYHYKNPLHFMDKDVSLGVIECMDVLFPGDDDMQNKILMEELPKYKNKTTIFEKSNVTKACSSNDSKFDPVEWWSNFGAITPNLQRLAMRILSLTTSSSCCERNWSTFDKTCTRNKNGLNASLLNDIAFVQFNARLLSNRKERDRNDKDVLSSNDATKSQEWIVGGIDDHNGDDDEGEDENGASMYSIVRELSDEFESGDEEVNENEDDLDEDEILRNLTV